MNKQNRTRVVLGVIYFVIGLLALLIKEDLYNYFNLLPFFVLTFGILLILTGISVILFIYVQGGFVKTIDNEGGSIETKKEIQKLRQELKDLISEKINDINTKDVNNELVQKHLNNITTDYLYQKIDDKYSTEIIEDRKVRELILDFESIYMRLGGETARLSRFGNINLSIGFLTTFMAIFFLGYSLLTVKTTETNNQTFIYHLIPRLSLSILIEIFSFFFLRMYKKNLDDIKYLNNERTNVELKLLAIKSAIIHGDDEERAFVIRSLATTERNFVLKKDESTVEVEKLKIDNNSSNQIWTNVFKILEKK